MKLIDNHIKNIVSLCKRHKVNRLFVFGSVLTDRFNDESDIDLVVDFKKDEVEDYFDNYFDFKYSLQDLFGRKVDLVEEQSIKNPYFRKSVDSTKQLIYGWEYKQALARYTGCDQWDRIILRRLAKVFQRVLQWPVFETGSGARYWDNRGSDEQDSEREQEHSHYQFPKIVDARNYIIHGYDSLSADILWSIVINHLPKLKEEAQTLLEQ